MKIFSRGFSFFLSIIMIISSIGYTVFSKESAEVESTLASVSSGSCGTSVTWEFMSDDGTLIIKGTGRMDNYKDGYPRAPWYTFSSSIKQVIIYSGVTFISTYAFNGCDNLTSVTIPETVSYIASYAFNNCSSLTKLHIKDLGAWCNMSFGTPLASPLELGCGLYLNGELIEELVIPEGVTDVAPDVFCKYPLKSVSFPETLKTIGARAFYGCELLTCVTLPDSVSTVDTSAFADCPALSSIDLGGVHYIGANAFSGTAVDEADIPASVISLDRTAFNNINAYNVHEDNIVYSSVDGILFSKDKTVLHYVPDLYSYESFTVPNQVDRIDDEAFINNKSLKSIVLGDNVREIGNNAFEHCSALESVSFGDGIKNIGNFAFSGCSSLKYIELYEGVEKIGGAAFSGCSSLSSVSLPDTVKEIGSNAFAKTALTEFVSPSELTEFDTSLFMSCKKLKNVVISGKVKRIGSEAFLGCSSLECIDIPDNVEIIEAGAFDDCVSLYDISLGCGLKAIGDIAFGNTAYLNNDANWSKGALYIGDYLIKTNEDISLDFAVKEGTLGIADYALQSRYSITSVSLPDSLGFIGMGCFDSCESLTELIIPNGITEIPEHMLSNCYSLTRVSIPDSVTRIESNAFFNTEVYNNSSNWNNYCLCLYGHLIDVNTAVVGTFSVPANLKTVAAGAFDGCNMISHIYFNSGCYYLAKSDFSACKNLDKISLPETLKGVDEDLYEELSYIDISCFEGSYAQEYIDRYFDSYLLFADEYAAMGKCGKDLKWTLDSNGVLRIFGSGETVENCYNCWYDYKSAVKKVVIEEGVTGIGMNAFRYCSNISSVSIPSSLVHMGGWAFSTGLGKWSSNCCYIGDFLISSLDNSNIMVKEGTKYIADCAFSDYLNITEISLPEGLMRIGESAFEYTNIKYMTIPDSVTYIGDKAFDCCTSLKGVKLPCGITSINPYTFFACYDLESIILPDTVTTIGNSAFSLCENLCDIYIPESVVNIESNAFKDCDKFTVRCKKGSYVDMFMQLNYPDAVLKYICDVHSFTNYISNNDGSCTEDGTMTAYCDNGCGESDTVKEENSRIHDYILDVLREPLCNKTGLGIYMCSLCQDYYTVSLPKDPLRHAFVDYSYNNDATCTTDGTKTAVCAYGCDVTETITEPGTALGHIYGEYTYNDDATCFKNGTKSAACQRCGYIDSIAVPGTMLTHRFTKYVSNNDTTCTYDGTLIAYCDNGCNAYAKKPNTGAAYGHDYVMSVSKAPTCTAVGSCKYECRRCGVYYMSSMDMLGHDYKNEIIEYPTCTESGTYLYVCSSCKDYFIEDIEPQGHSFGDWSIITAPTVTSEGLRTRTCLVCSYTEEDILPMLDDPYVYTEGHDICVTKIDRIKYIRYAKGSFTSASQIKSAPGCVTLDAVAIAIRSDDGVCRIEASEEGEYSVWIKYHDSSEYLYNITLDNIEESVTTDGVRVTLHNILGIKDFMISKGSHTSYADMKNERIVQISEARIGDAREYTYSVPKGGIYTICIRYKDTSLSHKYITFEVTQPEPSFVENGLQLNIENLAGVKVIRTAYGEYSTPGDIKKASTSRSFSAKDVLKGRDSYTVQYKDEGLVSVAVVYENGYSVMYEYLVAKKTPEMVVDNDTVTFTSLDGLKVIRYAEGEYSTSSEIKKAPDCVSVSGKSLSENKAVFTLDKGIYTFCVQYDDESYNYYTVTVN